MKHYTYRRHTFYHLSGHESFEDEHKNFEIKDREASVVEDAVVYLTDGSSYLNFPGAARAVAIATADFISRNFNEDFHEVLSDKSLMHGNDPYFKTYLEDKDIYDAILSKLPRQEIDWSNYRMSVTHRLIKAEYLLDEKGLEILPLEDQALE